VQHKGAPSYEMASELARSLPAPVILTGGLNSAEGVREAFRRTGVAAVMLARGALGNPWLFDELLRERGAAPTRGEVLSELDWTISRAVEHLGESRATRYLRKFYPWYVERLELEPPTAKRLQGELQEADSVAEARRLLAALEASRALARESLPAAV
jgi:tRNA-dihydrouridine synthase